MEKNIHNSNLKILSDNELKEINGGGFWVAFAIFFLIGVAIGLNAEP